VDPAKAAVGHQHHEIAGAVLADDRGDQVVDGRALAGGDAALPQVSDQL